MKKWLYAVISVIIIVAIATIYYFHYQNFAHITIETAGKSVTFVAERALTDQQKAKGLMYRKSLDKNKGMLFTFDSPQVIYMWMKNTYIPLDMIFIDDGKIVSIYQNAKPLDEHIISSTTFATSVLEINAGMVQKYNIKVGDKIRF